MYMLYLHMYNKELRYNEGRLAHAHRNRISYRNVEFHVEMGSAIKVCLSLFSLINIMKTVFIGLV